MLSVVKHLLPASTTNRSPAGRATTVTSTLAAAVASVAIPRRIMAASLRA